MPNGKTCLVLGASSQPGSWLVPLLIESGWIIHLVSRGRKPQFDYGPNAVWHTLDLRNPAAHFPNLGARVVFDTLGITTEWLESLGEAGARRVITFTSTSVFTKVDSADPTDIRMIAELR